jgi:GDPmannose 4,6-dehydratase
MWMMLQADKPDTFVLATNRTETVRNFVQLAFRAVDIDVEFTGDGKAERGRCKRTGKELVAINPRYFRPAEVELLIGDASKAQTILGWQANTQLEELCAMMVSADLERVRTGKSF